MSADHPFVQRTRLEREAIGLVNAYVGPFGPELPGVGAKAILVWAEKMKGAVDAKELAVLQERLVGFSAAVRALSGHSHRGAMVGPLPQTEVAGEYLADIRISLDRLFREG